MSKIRDLAGGARSVAAEALENARFLARRDGRETPLLALMVGNPIAQVKAPRLLNPRFVAEGLPITMVEIELPVDGFDLAFGELLSVRDVVAAVVTVPFKIQAAALCDGLERSAQLAGAVNLLTRQPNGTWNGAMTDGVGFAVALEQVGFNPIGRKALMAGAGGAGSGIAGELIQRGLASLDVFDPDAEKLTRLEKVLGVKGLAGPPPQLGGYDLLINATPLGLKPDDPLPFDLETARNDAFVGDVIAEPEFTAWRRRAEQLGLNSTGGMEMLKGQIEAIWNGVAGAVAAAQQGG